MIYLTSGDEKLSDVSSAKSRAKPVNSSDISLIEIRKSRGPRTDPCGAPAFMVCCFEKVSLRKTFWLLLNKIIHEP